MSKPPKAPDPLPPAELRELRKVAQGYAELAMRTPAHIANGDADPKKAGAQVNAAKAILANVLPYISESKVERHDTHTHDIRKLGKAELAALVDEQFGSRFPKGEVTEAEIIIYFNDLSSVDDEKLPENRQIDGGEASS